MSGDLSPIWAPEPLPYVYEIDRQLEDLNYRMERNLYMATLMRDELQLAIDIDRQLRGGDASDDANINDQFLMDEDLEYEDIQFTPRRVMFDDAVYEIPADDGDRTTVDHDYVFRNYTEEADSDDDTDTVVEEWIDPLRTPGHLRDNLDFLDILE